MEGYGIAKECVYYSRIPCFIIKSICDWGVLKNITNNLLGEEIILPKFFKDKLQAYACFCAGVVFFKLLKQEKDKLLSLKIYNEVNNSVNGNKFLEGIKYYTPQEIVEWLSRYYSIKEDYAKQIFKMLIKRNYIKKTNNLETLYKYNTKKKDV